MTEFQEKVYKVVAQIPKGQTKTYKEVAIAVGQPRACRAVGNALNKNYNKDIPCHRVIAACDIGGYNRGRNNKINLLRSEGAI